MELTQLKTFIHVAELGSLSRAAERLRVAQPSLSRQIRLMEEELGVPLFDRHGRGMVITPIGREVLERAQRILSEIESIREMTRQAPDALRGTVAVGAPPTVAEIMTVPLVARIRARHPDLSLRLTSAYSGYLLDWLQRGELDLMLSYSPQVAGTLRVSEVMMENLLLVRPAEAALSLDRPVRFSELARLGMILPSRRHGLRAILEGCALRAGITLNTVVEADAFSSLIGLVRAGVGATVLPLAPIYAQVAGGALSAAPLIEPTPMRKLVIVFPADRRTSAAAAFVAQTFREVARDLVDRGIWAGHMLDPPGEK